VKQFDSVINIGCTFPHAEVYNMLQLGTLCSNRGMHIVIDLIKLHLRNNLLMACYSILV